MEQIITRSVNGIVMEAHILSVGKDYAVLLTGGEKPHIGTSVLAIPRASLQNETKISATSSVMNVMGHKDEVVVRPIAEKLSAALNTTVLCTGGIHVNQLSEKQRESVIRCVEEIEEEIVRICRGQKN